LQSLGEGCSISADRGRSHVRWSATIFVLQNAHDLDLGGIAFSRRVVF
jgi:hypothetical protein